MERKNDRGGRGRNWRKERWEGKRSEKIRVGEGVYDMVGDADGTRIGIGGLVREKSG